MNYKTYITLFKNKFLKKKTVVRDPQLMHPEREWAIGLFMAVFIFSFCGLWSIHTYLKNRSASALVVEETGGETVYRESVVKETLETVTKRRQTLELLTSEPSTPPIVVEEIATTSPEGIEIEEPTEVVVEEPVAEITEN